MFGKSLKTGVGGLWAPIYDQFRTDYKFPKQTKKRPTYGAQLYTPPPRWDFRNRLPSRKNVPGAKIASRGGGVYNLRAFKHQKFIHHHRPETLNMPYIIGKPRESRIPLGAVVVYRDPFRIYTAPHEEIQAASADKLS